ncbi:MAG: oxygen-independent coproporphyrinogen-3 oxidase [Bacteriovoracaceae bacterium]|jgi:oxygen-independent coproporphyrinogen-3 oxidase
MERTAKIPEYHKMLNLSIDRLKDFYDKNEVSLGELKTIYIGGGTPSLWGEEGVKFLRSFFAEHKIEVSDQCEMTLEVNPGTWTDKGLDAFRGFGFNRFSLGIQSTRNDFLEKLDRVHRHEEVINTLEKFNSMKANFSVDFMLGLPFSREYERNIKEELDQILSFNPSHISLYILTVKDNYVYYEALPDEEWIEREFLEVSSYLREKGFLHYEVSNFSLPGKESLHNSRYWSGESICALGPSATGYVQKTGVRYKWKPYVAEFDSEKLTENEIRMEKFYLNLRTNKGIELEDFFTGDELGDARSLAKSWNERGLCQLREGALALTPRGYLLMDSLMDEVFSRLKTL